MHGAIVSVPHVMPAAKKCKRWVVGLVTCMLPTTCVALSWILCFIQCAEFEFQMPCIQQNTALHVCPMMMLLVVVVHVGSPRAVATAPTTQTGPQRHPWLCCCCCCLCLLCAGL